MPQRDLQPEPPPEMPVPQPRSMGQMLMMLPMLAGAGGMALMYAGNRGAGPTTYVAGGLFAISMLGMVGTTISGSRNLSAAEVDAQRRDYLRRLTQLRRSVRRSRKEQREALVWRHPAPDTLWSIAAGERLWERRPTDEDFGELRFALGRQRLAVRIRQPETKPVEDLEPLTAMALRRFFTTYTVLDNVPAALSLTAWSRVVLTGERDEVLDLCRALLAQAAAWHSPDDLWLALCAPEDRWTTWDWMKWLPHLLDPVKSDGAGPCRRVAPTLPELEAALSAVLSGRPRHSANGPVTQPHLLVVLDGGEISADCQLLGDGSQGTTVLDLSGVVPSRVNPSTAVLRVESDAGGHRLVRSQGGEVLGIPDRLTGRQSAALARQMAALRISVASTADGPEPMARTRVLTDLLHVGRPEHLDPAVTWRSRPSRDRLRIPIGVDPHGYPVELDFKESAQDGMGPHGILIGATGTGKSELLRTIVAGLAITHSPEELNFVLIDFKGNSTFPGLNLPHNSALITNLEEDLPLVDRMHDALRGELMRRQELLAASGADSLETYQQKRRAGAPLGPLPTLVVICDEFSEMLQAKPEFLDLFLMIGRLGRSLGIHMLVASQHLEEGRLRGLDTHLSYRLALRTFKEVESRMVIGVTDAYHLPRQPGHGLLKSDTATLQRFLGAYVSGPWRPVDERGPTDRAPATRAAQTVPYTLAPVLASTPEPAPDMVPAEQGADRGDTDSGQRVLDVIVHRLAGHGPRAHQVWLPPLSTPPTLDELLPELTVDPSRGLSAVNPSGPDRLVVPVGLVDRPLHQRRDVLTAELEAAAGHVVVAGGPRSGKSTLLRTLICSTALVRTPAEAQFYCLDFGGGTLTALRDLPHVGGVAVRTDPNTVRRLLAEITELLEEREQRFHQFGIDSMSTYRRRRASGEQLDDARGDVFLVIDGWGTLRQEFEHLEQVITSLAARGLAYGIHVVISVTRWAELRSALRDMLGTRFELRLGDPSESQVDRRLAGGVPVDAPGRGLSGDKLHYLTALPRIDGIASADDLVTGVSHLVARVRSAWAGPAAPPVRLLQPLYAIDQLPPPEDSRGLPVGIGEAALQPVFLDFATEPHFMVFGDQGSGKTSFLRLVIHQLVTKYPPDRARIILVDYRRTLVDVGADDHLIGYAPSGAALAGMVKDVTASMRKRLPAPDATREQLRNRNRWSGPELYIVVDDYELVVASPGHPLGQLLEFLQQGTDVGLHLIVARRTGGAPRALLENVLKTLTDMEAPGLMLSGDSREGPLLKGSTSRPSRQPPGRGTLVNRQLGSQLAQIAYCPSDDPPVAT